MSERQIKAKIKAILEAKRPKYLVENNLIKEDAGSPSHRDDKIEIAMQAIVVNSNTGNFL